MTRGERNFNYGNLERGTTQWQGMAADQSGDPRFIVFTAPEFGVRALAKTLLTYARKYHLNTVRGLINRWAPGTENDTESYIAAVAKQCTVSPDDILNVNNEHCLEMLVRGIIHHENGRVAVDDAVITKGIGMALQ